MTTYAIYFTWNDGFEDVIEEKGAKARDISIKEMLNRKEFKAISYRAKYKNGEYGRTVSIM